MIVRRNIYIQEFDVMNCAITQHLGNTPFGPLALATRILKFDNKEPRYINIRDSLMGEYKYTRACFWSLDNH